MKRKVFILSLIILIVVSMVMLLIMPSQVRAETATDENSITWSFRISTDWKDNSKYLSKLAYYSGTIPADGKIVLPATLTVDGVEYPVREIGEGSSQKSMFNSASTTNRNKIKEIVIPDTVEDVNSYAFYNLTNLTKIEFGEKVNSIWAYVISGTNVSEIVLPKALTYPSSYAFATYSNRDNVKVTKIVVNDKCSVNMLKSLVRYTPNVKEWAVYEDSEKYKVVDGEIYSKDGETLYAIKPHYQGSTYIVKETVKHIGDYVFSGEENLQSVDLPDSLLSIGYEAFSGCRGLSGELVLPESLVKIGGGAFQYCSGFTGDLIIPNSVVSLGYSTFSGCGGFDGNLIVGDGVEHINYGTFSGMTNLKRITLGSGVKYIEAYAFEELTDFWINCYEGEVYLSENYGGENTDPVPHYLNETHRVTIGTSEGIRIINTTTNTELLSGNYECETSFKYKVTIEPGYNYSNLKVIEINNNDYENAIVYDYEPGREYDFSTLLRDRKIFVETLSEGNDLSLRTFITAVNYISVDSSRNSVFDLVQGKFKYLHSKRPIRVENNDDITYRIRIYNEGMTKSSADEIKVYIPAGMAVDLEHTINQKNGWTQVEEGIIKTNKLEGNLIDGYYGNGNISFAETEVVLKVTDTNAENEIYKTVFAEIVRQSSSDVDSTPGNVVVSQNYMIDEISNSNSNSAIDSQEDDDDFETVVLNAKFRASYSIRVNKVDSSTDELLKGAKFKLVSVGENQLEVKDENTNQKVLKTFADGEIIATAVSGENGIIEFTGLTSFGEGEDEYLVEEVNPPVGYLANESKKVNIRVAKESLNSQEGTFTLKVFCYITEEQVDTSRLEFIPIKTAEQLSKIGSGETINIDGTDYTYNIEENYKLMNDIDLSGINWTPIKNEIKGIFEGNGHKISNLSIVSADLLPYSEVGLISTFSGIVQNLTLENPKIQFSGYTDSAVSNTGYTGVGTFAGTMREGGIYNCKTTVTDGVESGIKVAVDNVGGIVGQTLPEGLVIVANCENNIEIVGQKYTVNGTEVGSKNIGGIIGSALGSITVRDTVNNGHIVASGESAGGLVGFVKPSNYKQPTAFIAYDEDGKYVDILVENKSIQGQYNLTLEVRDAKTRELIPGAAYDIDKIEDSIVTKLLETGSLKLFDKVINYTGNDIYFLIEKQSIEEYSSLDGVIKLNVERYWDSSEDKYKVRAEAIIISQKEYEEFTGNRETNNKDVQGQVIDRDAIFTDANRAKINWNTCKVEFANSINNGEIESELTKAGGLLGTSYGAVNFENCTNNGKISSKAKAGGIIAELRSIDSIKEPTPQIPTTTPEPGGSLGTPGTLEKYETQNTKENSKFTNCINNGKITTDGDTVETIGNAGGIISEITGYAIISNAVNNGEVVSSGGRPIAGIAGQVMGGIEIKNSTNKGEITSNNSGELDIFGYNYAAGIMGQLRCIERYCEAMPYENTFVRISGNKNYANITGAGTTAGILASADGNEVTITNCEIKGISGSKLNISMTGDGECAGILATESCKYTNLKDNLVENCNIEIENGADDDLAIQPLPVDIPVEQDEPTPDENIVEIHANTCAGILAYATNDKDGSRPVESIILKNNTLKNSAVINRRGDTAGIIALSEITRANSSTKEITSITNCIVENSEITSYTKSNIAGIFANASSSGNLDINSCVVDNTKIKKDYDSTIEPNTSDTEIEHGEKQLNMAGILGKANYKSRLTIVYSDVKNTVIESTMEEGIEVKGRSALIFAEGYGNNELVIKECSITDSAIKDSLRDAAGIAGSIGGTSGRLIIEDCEILRTDLVDVYVAGNDNPHNYYYTVQHNVGYVLAEANKNKNVEIANINIIGKDLPKGSEDRTKIEFFGEYLGGVIGEIGGLDKVKASDISIKNIDITNIIGNRSEWDVNGLSIGAFAGSFNCDGEFKNIIVDNCDIKADKAVATSGFIGSLAGNGKLTNIEVKDTNITVDEGPMESYNKWYAAGLVAIQQLEATYENCKVENCTILAPSTITVGKYVGTPQSINDDLIAVENSRTSSTDSSSSSNRRLAPVQDFNVKDDLADNTKNSVDDKQSDEKADKKDDDKVDNTAIKKENDEDNESAKKVDDTSGVKDGDDEKDDDTGNIKVDNAEKTNDDGKVTGDENKE